MTSQTDIVSPENTDFILLINNRQEKKVVSLKLPSIKWGKKHNFKTSELLGKKYNNYYELDRNQVIPLNISNVDVSEEISSDEEEKIDPEVMISEPNTNDNRDIYDGNNAQKLCRDDITKFKAEGGKVENLIEKLKENSQTFQKKTVFSQEKYIKKKKSKHMFYFCLKRITLERLAQAHYAAESPMKINFLRFDSLALFLQYANVAKGANLLIIEKTKGLILAGVSQRLNGLGQITFGFYEEVKKPLNQIACFNQLNLCRNKNDNIKLIEFDYMLKNTLEFNNTYTHLLIAGELNVKEIVSKTLPFLQNGSILVVFSIFLEPIAELFEFLKKDGKFLMVKIMDIFTRSYQVLENRTHPHVNMEGFSGYILSGYKVEYTEK